jgi:hypothetical protein
MTLMDTAELMRLLSTGPNAARLAVVAGDASWNLASDWGLGNDWMVVRVPVGLKFRRYHNGLVAEELLVVGGRGQDRQLHERLLSRSRVPAHLLFVDRPQAGHNRLAALFGQLHIGRDS